MPRPNDAGAAAPRPHGTESGQMAGPPQSRYHRPEVGGRYAPRFAAAATSGNITWLAWHGYEPDTALDHVYAQAFESGKRGELHCLTAAPGINDRPAAVLPPDGAARVLWVRDGCHLLHRAFDPGRRVWSEAAELPGTGDWLRDVETCCGVDGQVWAAAVSSAGRDDRLVLHGCDGGKWRLAGELSLPGFLARPAVLVAADGRVVVALDQYQGGRYRVLVVAWQDGSWQELFVAGDDSAGCLSPRLTLDAHGHLWLCWLHDVVVERDGVINRAATVRVAVERDGRWQAVPGSAGPEVAYLYRGLLPISRYLGYSGLRRNPHLVATSDGAVHLLYEVQRDEADWANVWTGRLEGVSYRGGRFEAPGCWYDEGVCYGVDTRAMHRADAVAITFKSTHREQGDDFVVCDIDPGRTSPTMPESLATWRGWRPYATAARRAERSEIEVDGQPLRLYFGDLHNHCVFSPDAEGYPDEVYHFARDVAGIDFAGITDNDFYPEKALHASESAYQRQLVARLAEPGRFLPFCGFEWTFHRDDGDDTYNHRSVIFMGGESRVIRRIDPAGSSEEALRRTMATMDVFAHAHHAHFEPLGIAQDANVEITSGWMVSIEKAGIAHRRLDEGHRFGFLGASDSHRLTPGLGGALAGVWATELTYAALADALRQRRCYATMGNRTVIDLRLNGALMGSVVPCSGRRLFSIRVRADTPLRQVSIIRNGTTVAQWDGDGQVFAKEWADDDAPPGAAWYYLRVEDCTPYQDHPHNVCQAVGPLAWSSPIWAVGGER